MCIDYQPIIIQFQIASHFFTFKYLRLASTLNSIRVLYHEKYRQLLTVHGASECQTAHTHNYGVHAVVLRARTC